MEPHPEIAVAHGKREVNSIKKVGKKPTLRTNMITSMPLATPTDGIAVSVPCAAHTPINDVPIDSATGKRTMQSRTSRDDTST